MYAALLWSVNSLTLSSGAADFFFAVELVAQSVTAKLGLPAHKELFRQVVRDIMLDEAQRCAVQRANTGEADLANAKEEPKAKKFLSFYSDEEEDYSDEEEVEVEAAGEQVAHFPQVPPALAAEIPQASPVLTGLSSAAVRIVRDLPFKTVARPGRDITYFIPKEGSKPPFYFIGRGLAVGIFTNLLVFLLVCVSLYSWSN